MQERETTANLGYIIAERMDGKPVAEVHNEGTTTVKVVTGIEE